MSLIELFLKCVMRYASRSALWVENEFYSYQKLYEIAISIAKTLSQFSAERCIILSSRNITAYSSIIAILLADKTYVPLNPNYPITVNLNLLESIDTNLLIIDERLSYYASNIANSCKKSLIMIFDSPNSITLELEKSQHKILYINKSAHQFFHYKFKNPYAYLLFTSGSTGQPKGILISHQNVLAYVKNMLDRCQPNETDRFSQLADLTFDFSVHDLFVAWASGACVYSISKEHLMHWQHFMAQHRLTFWAAVPSAVQFLRYTNQLQPNCLPTLRYSVFCGESLSQSLAACWQKAAPNSIIDNLYGPTEATVACAGFLWQASENVKSEIVPIGFPFPDQSYQIINDELCLTGSQVITHYWRNALLTEQRFFYLPHDDRIWYRTGDIVAWDDRVGLIYKGRLDDQFKLRGRCVTKLEIESALRTLAETSSVAVLPWSPVKNGCIEKIFAFVSHTQFTPDDLLKKARAKLPEHMVPETIFKLAALPLNSNGKTDYLQLERLL